MADLTVYEKRTCTTCRKLSELLDERGIDFDAGRVPRRGPARAQAARAAAQGGRGRATSLRAREPLAAELDLVDNPPPDDELIRLMAEHPELVQRPIVERGDRALLARPVERVLELLD